MYTSFLLLHQIWSGFMHLRCSLLSSHISMYALCSACFFPPQSSLYLCTAQGWECCCAAISFVTLTWGCRRTNSSFLFCPLIYTSIIKSIDPKKKKAGTLVEVIPRGFHTKAAKWSWEGGPKLGCTISSGWDFQLAGCKGIKDMVHKL